MYWRSPVGLLLAQSSRRAEETTTLCYALVKLISFLGSLHLRGSLLVRIVTIEGLPPDLAIDHTKH